MRILTRFFASCLLLSPALSGELPHAIDGDDPIVWLPAEVAHLRVLDDGTWVMVGDGPKPKSIGDVRWLDRQAPVEALGVDPHLLLIDELGQAWYTFLEASACTNIVVQNETGMQVLDLEARALGAPIPLHGGGVWLRREDGFSQFRDGALTHFPRAKGIWRMVDSAAGNTLLFRSSETDAFFYREEGRALSRVELPAPFLSGMGLLTNRWFMQGVDNQPAIWRTPGSKMPQRMSHLLRDLGDDTFKVREQAQAALDVEGRLWRESLQRLLPRIADPETRQRLGDLLANWSAAPAAPLPPPFGPPAAGTGAWPHNSILRAEGSSLRHVLLADSPGAEFEQVDSGYCHPPWRWLTMDAAGEVTVITTNISARLRPGGVRPGERFRGHDLLDLGEGRWACRNAGKQFQIFHPDGMLDLELPPPPDALGLEDCRLLHVTENGGIVFRRFGRVGLLRPAAWQTARPSRPWVHTPPSDEINLKIRKWIQSLEDDEGTEVEARIKELQALLRVYPDFALGYYQMGSLAATAGDYEKAIKGFSRYYGFLGNNQALYLLSQQYGQSKDYPEAIRLLSGLLDQPPAVLWYNGSYLLSRGNAHLEHQNWAEAIRDFERCLKIDPDNVTAWNNIAWLRCTSPDPAIRNADEAIKLAKRACEMSEWERGYTIDTLAAAYAEKGDWDQALKMQRRAMGLLDPDDEESGFIYETHLKQFQERKPIRLPEPEFQPKAK